MVKALRGLRARLAAVDPTRADAALALLFVVAGVVELSLVDAGGRDRAVTVAAGAVALAAIALRRRDALLAAVLFVLPHVGQALLDGYLTRDSTTPFVAVLFLMYSIGRYAPPGRFAPAAALLVLGTGLTLIFESVFEFSELFWLIMLFGLPLAAGRALRSRALLQAELRDKAERTERERAARARHAVDDERSRIASELQALVANGLSAMVVQAETVPHALASGDSGGAGRAFAAVEATGRDALTEMRRLLGVLRRDGDGAELAPQPGLGRLGGLVARVRGGGLGVELRVLGAERPLPPGVDLTAYRVLEDALEAASERGASRARLILRYGADQLDLEVADDREGGGSNRLPGLRDRVGLYGGHLRAGRDQGEFRLRARLPLEEGA